MKVAIDATPWRNRRGFGRYTRSVIRALAAHGDLELTLLFDGAPPGDAPDGVRTMAVGTSAPQDQRVATGRRPVADLLRMSAALSRERPDVFFEPSIDAAFPLFGRFGRVVAIHDLIPEQHPEWTALSSGALRLRRLKVFLALRQADRIAASSRRLREVIEQWSRVSTAVIPYGADPVFRPDGDRAPGRYLLHVGRGPHKNVGALVRAFESVRREGDTLVLAGHPEAAGAGITGLDAPGDTDLAALYRGARALVLPSLVEGFGLPVLEAAACGTPSIASAAVPAAHELAAAVRIVGEGELSEALASALRGGGEWETRRRAAAEVAAPWRWERSAAVAVEVFRTLA